MAPCYSIGIHGCTTICGNRGMAMVSCTARLVPITLFLVDMYKLIIGLVMMVDEIAYFMPFSWLLCTASIAVGLVVFGRRAKTDAGGSTGKYAIRMSQVSQDGQTMAVAGPSNAADTGNLTTVNSPSAGGRYTSPQMAARRRSMMGEMPFPKSPDGGMMNKRASGRMSILLPPPMINGVALSSGSPRASPRLAPSPRRATSMVPMTTPTMTSSSPSPLPVTPRRGTGPPGQLTLTTTNSSTANGAYLSMVDKTNTNTTTTGSAPPTPQRPLSSAGQFSSSNDTFTSSSYTGSKNGRNSGRASGIGIVGGWMAHSSPAFAATTTTITTNTNTNNV
jgi:hypothetical protein